MAWWMRWMSTSSCRIKGSGAIDGWALEGLEAAPFVGGVALYKLSVFRSNAEAQRARRNAEQKSTEIDSVFSLCALRFCVRSERVTDYRRSSREARRPPILLWFRGTIPGRRAFLIGC